MGSLDWASETSRSLVMIFRQLFDKESSTYTYLLGDSDTKEALFIDPVIENSERDAKLVRELGLSLKYVMNTHGHADLLVKDGDRIQFGTSSVLVAETPGHTAGCVTYIDNQTARAFTGDALLIRGCGRTDFQGGSAE